MLKSLLIPLNALLNNNAKSNEMPIFSEDELLEYLKQGEQTVKSLLKVEDTNNHKNLVVEYAYYLSLMSKSLIIKGREYMIKNNGVYTNPPNVADHMMQIANTLINNWFRKVELIINQNLIKLNTK